MIFNSRIKLSQKKYSFLFALKNKKFFKSSLVFPRLAPLLVFSLFLFLSISIPIKSSAEPTPRKVEMEWEVIKGAESYQLSIVKKGQAEQKSDIYESKENTFVGQFLPGHYLLKIRTLNENHVAGKWGAASDFEVGLESVKGLRPRNGAELASKNPRFQELQVAWDPVPNADQYVFSIESSDGSFKKTEQVAALFLKLELPVAMKYTWQVKAMTEEGIASESPAESQFTLAGARLETPEITAPENEFVREMEWTKPDFTQGFDVVISSYETKSGAWVKLKELKNFNETSLQFEPKWSGGRYQLEVQAKGSLRPDSKTARIEFGVRSGNRSAVAENEYRKVTEAADRRNAAAKFISRLRSSFERSRGWYGFASYQITQIKYIGSNAEKNSSTSFDAIGGTGRLGLGWYHPKNLFGFVGMADFGGFTLQGKVQTYAAVEANLVTKKASGDKGEYRFQVGAFYKEVPESIGDPSLGTVNFDKVSAVGPHLGLEYWHSLTPKLGLQINGHVYLPLLKIQTPNDQDISSVTSYQLGLLGSYRLSRQITGLMGITQRTDGLSYKATTGPASYASADSVNKSSLNGTFLSFLLESNF